VTGLGEIIGTGLTAFVKASAEPADVLGAQALRLALADAEVDLADVDLVVGASRFEHPALGQRVLRRLGATGASVINTENACVSGMTGLQIALAHVGAGMARLAAVVGVERPSGLGTRTIPLPDADPYGRVGLTHPARYALEASSYCHRHGVDPAVLGAVAVKNRAHAVGNPKARFGTPVSLDEVVGAPMIAPPLTRLQCCGNADGAAAVLVAPAGRRRRAGAVRVRALATRSGRLTELPQARPLTTRVAAIAYDAAGIGPDEVDVAEVYDGFSILEVLSVEHLGFADEGSAAGRIAGGAFRLGAGGMTTNPSGGLLGRGHPLGATALAQVAEVVDQLRDRSGPRQVAGARVGLVHTLGGNLRDLEANAAAVAVLDR
jgi:acetyl-CoA acetyltransferase